MAQRRMFSQKIVSSDAFLDMPTSSRELYFQLGMYADDDGFINPKKIVRMVGASDDDLKVLIGKRFVVPFENGVVVIKHWKINNLIRKDFYQETVYLEEKKQLKLKENNAYTEVSKQIVNNPLTQVRSGKDSIDKDSIEHRADFPPQNDLERKELIKFFIGTINPHLKYNNKTENRACTDLLKAYGLEKTKSALLFLEEKRKTDKYLPTITTPYELWTKWAKIKQHLEVKKGRKIWRQNMSPSPQVGQNTALAN